MNIVTVLPHERMMNFIIKDVRDVYREDLKNKICYISLNKSHTSLMQSLIDENANVDRFFIVDAVTRGAVKDPQVPSNCVFVNSPADFDELFRKIDKVLAKDEFGAVVFDSVCTLFSHGENKEVLSFLIRLATRVSVAACEGVFVAIKPNIEPEILDRLTIVADRVFFMEGT